MMMHFDTNQAQVDDLNLDQFFLDNFKDTEMEVDDLTPPAKNTQSLFDSDIDTEFSLIV